MSASVVEIPVEHRIAAKQERVHILTGAVCNNGRLLQTMGAVMTGEGRSSLTGCALSVG